MERLFQMVSVKYKVPKPVFDLAHEQSSQRPLLSISHNTHGCSGIYNPSLFMVQHSSVNVHSTIVNVTIAWGIWYIVCAYVAMSMPRTL